MSKRKHILYCKSEEGRFKFEKPLNIKNLPGKFDEGKRLKVTWEYYKPMKSLSQLGYYRAGILPFLVKECGDDTGIDKEYILHELLKRTCGIMLELPGLDPIPKSHADYTEIEMAMFIKKVQAWAADFLNVAIPPPAVIDEYV